MVETLGRVMLILTFILGLVVYAYIVRFLFERFFDWLDQRREQDD